MKPKKIYLVRHGESEGNVDYESYAKKPDYQLMLTPKGIEQATMDAGVKMKKLLGDSKVMCYVSPLWRTRMTFQCICTNLNKENLTIREEPRLREQEWGHQRPVEESNRLDAERSLYGTFYYRLPDGESCADVYDRIGSFFNTLHRDFEKPDFPENVMIVTHGTAIRLFIMRWFHLTVEEFESTKNPHNCEIFEMELQENNKYKLITPLKRKQIDSHMVYNWSPENEAAFVSTPYLSPDLIDKREWTVILTDHGQKKLGIVRYLHESLKIGLREARDLASDLPKELKVFDDEKSAEKFMKELTDIGASVRLT